MIRRGVEGKTVVGGKQEKFGLTTDEEVRDYLAHLTNALT